MAAAAAAAAFLTPSFGCDVGLRLLLSPVTSTVLTRTACVAVGVGFPVYSTFKTLEQKDEQEQEKWLIYWTVYGCFHIVEIFSDKFLSWFPYYYPAKLAFLIWLQLPISDGARCCFMHHIRPFLLKHESKLDTVVFATQNAVNNFVASHKQEIQFIQSGAKKLIESVKDNFFGPNASNAPRPGRSLPSTLPTEEDVLDADDSESEDGRSVR